MNTSVDTASVVIAVFYVLSALLLFGVGIPQASAWVRLGGGFDGLQPFRLKTGLLSNAFGLFLVWRAVVYLDYALYDQQIMGVLGARWPIELVISALVLLASGYTTVLYVMVRTRADERAGSHAQADRMEATGLRALEYGRDTNARVQAEETRRHDAEDETP